MRYDLVTESEIKGRPENGLTPDDSEYDSCFGCIADILTSNECDKIRCGLDTVAVENEDGKYEIELYGETTNED